MPLVVKPFIFVNGTVADANEVNADFDTLYNLVNGALDEDNLAAVLDFSAKTITFGPNTTFTGDLVFESNEGAGGTGTISHANTAPRAWDFPDADGTIVLTSGGATLPVHTHADANEGGQLDWDDVWSDAVHNHQNAGEGGTLDTAAIGSGTFANARISSGNVTQHQGDIDHNSLNNLAVGNPHPQYAQSAGDPGFTGDPDFTGQPAFEELLFVEDIADRGNANNYVREYVVDLDTPSNALTPAITWTLPDQGDKVISFYWVTMMRTDANQTQGGYEAGVVYGTHTGGANISSNSAAFHTLFGSGGSVSVTTPAGNDIILNVTGIAGQNMRWRIKVQEHIFND